VLATTCRILDLIRTTYERERQPETLQEASGYLHRLTQGRYRRVWTPLGENVLRVDDAEGHCLPVEMLSRGTREQLFLSVRMALAASYARRGAALPLVLDDVLVNFDADRAAAAAAVLRDFAAAGHQLVVFTCHEHISNIFTSLSVPVSRLPSTSQAGRTLISFEMPEIKVEVESEGKQARNRTPGKRKTVPKTKTPVQEIELLPAPIDHKPSIEKQAIKHRPTPIAKPNAKTQGVFDVDFFDSAENTENPATASEHHPLYRENDSDEDDEYYQFDNDNNAEAA
jgi:hypothetical protein